MATTKNTINFSVGMILGVIGSAMWQYDKFLYYSVFCLQTIILFILINSSTSANADPSGSLIANKRERKRSPKKS